MSRVPGPEQRCLRCVRSSPVDRSAKRLDTAPHGCRSSAASRLSTPSLLLASSAPPPLLGLASGTSPSLRRRLSLPQRHFPQPRFHSRSGSARAPDRRRPDLQLVRRVPLSL